MRTFHIVYPEKRVLTEKQVRTYYNDAVANGKTEDFGDNVTSVDEMVKILDDIGDFTFSRR